MATPRARGRVLTTPLCLPGVGWVRSDPPLCPTRLFCWRQVAGTDADVGMLRRAGVWSQEGLRSLRAELPKREPCCVSLVMHAREHECVWGDTRACALAQARLWAAPPLEAAAAGVMRPGSFQVWFLSSDPAGLVDPQSAGLTRLGAFLACTGQLMAGSLLEGHGLLGTRWRRSQAQGHASSDARPPVPREQPGSPGGVSSSRFPHGHPPLPRAPWGPGPGPCLRVVATEASLSSAHMS